MTTNGYNIGPRTAAGLRDLLAVTPRRSLRAGRRSIDVAAPGVRWFRVVASTLIADNRWEYTLADIDDDEDTVTAINRMEDANTASEAGPSYDIAGLPTGLVLLPIGKDRNGVDIECVVDAYLGMDDDGAPQWWFCAVNVVDGECSGAGSGDALTSDPLSQFAPTTSAQLLGVITDETGSGSLVFSNAPTLVAPAIGAATATSVNKVAITAPATSATLTIADGKTLAATEDATLNGANLMVGADYNNNVMRSGLVAGLTFTTITNTAYWVYVGRTTVACTPKWVEFYVRSVGSGAQTAEVVLASTPTEPRGASLTLTKIEGTGTVDSLTSSGTKRNTSAFTTSVPANTHLWAGIRTAMATTQPNMSALGIDMDQGYCLSTATPGALTGSSSWTGVPIAASLSGIVPDLRVRIL